MKDKFLKQTTREFSPGKRIMALMVEGVFFLGVLPGTLVHFSPLLDHQLKLPSLAFGVINTVSGCGLIAGGILLAWWSIYVQFTIGRGTPVPVMATQQLIVQKPYSYCRNPMALGAIVLYLGVAILIGSISAAGSVLIFAVVLLTYIKFGEEREMELRFGEAYREYRKRTPFIIPRITQTPAVNGSSNRNQRTGP
jgi:protein-S-isoprenylcysteine O-methyltransferase Ste14